jgi:hypothetical protein
MFMAFVGGFGFARSISYHPGTRVWPAAHNARSAGCWHRVTAPDDDQARSGKKLDLHADFAAQGLRQFRHQR